MTHCIEMWLEMCCGKKKKAERRDENLNLLH